MKRNLAIWAIALGLVVSVAGLVQAQETTTTQQTTTTTTSSDNSATMPDSHPATSAQDNTLAAKDSATTPPTDATPTATDDKSSNVRTVTGCLRAGDNSKEYELNGQDGST